MAELLREVHTIEVDAAAAEGVRAIHAHLGRAGKALTPDAFAELRQVLADALLHVHVEGVEG